MTHDAIPQRVRGEGAALLARDMVKTLDTLTALQRDFPDWAMWRYGDGTWVATRTPGDQEPSPGSRLLWVYADSAEDLVARIRKGEAMGDDEWGQADRAVERLRAVLGRACEIPPNAITWSYGGSSGQWCRTSINIRMDVPQGRDLADVAERGALRPPAGAS